MPGDSLRGHKPREAEPQAERWEPAQLRSRCMTVSSQWLWLSKRWEENSGTSSEKRGKNREEAGMVSHQPFWRKGEERMLRFSCLINIFYHFSEVPARKKRHHSLPSNWNPEIRLWIITHSSQQRSLISSSLNDIFKTNEFLKIFLPHIWETETPQGFNTKSSFNIMQDIYFSSHHVFWVPLFLGAIKHIFKLVSRYLIIPY